MDDDIIPPQEKGSRSGVSKVVALPSVGEAVQLFEKAKGKLCDINNWHKYAGLGSADFHLTDFRGNLIETQGLEVGQLIRISLPGLGNPSGKGYDWVRVEAVVHERADVDQFFAFRLRPIGAPKDMDEDDTHFYTSEASNTFLLIQRGAKVSIVQEGRNEMANIRSHSLVTDVRNFLVGMSAKLGFSKTQWEKLITGILKQ
ncbi:MAG TPA: hypothetical protein VL947_03920 [Cytophagales bacterium]|nr:hypothetical protein [Cytophagales bacterium]